MGKVRNNKIQKRSQPNCYFWSTRSKSTCVWSMHEAPRRRLAVHLSHPLTPPFNLSLPSPYLRDQPTPLGSNPAVAQVLLAQICHLTSSISIDSRVQASWLVLEISVWLWPINNKVIRVPWWPRGWMRMQRCHCCGRGSVPCLGTSTCHECGQNINNEVSEISSFWSFLSLGQMDNFKTKDQSSCGTQSGSYACKLLTPLPGYSPSSCDGWNTRIVAAELTFNTWQALSMD